MIILFLFQSDMSLPPSCPAGFCYVLSTTPGETSVNYIGNSKGINPRLSVDFLPSHVVELKDLNYMDTTKPFSCVCLVIHHKVCASLKSLRIVICIYRFLSLSLLPSLPLSLSPSVSLSLPSLPFPPSLPLSLSLSPSPSLSLSLSLPPSPPLSLSLYIYIIHYNISHLCRCLVSPNLYNNIRFYTLVLYNRVIFFKINVVLFYKVV